MISKNSVQWNDEYKYDGVLYFAQRIVEMLDFKTIDIYRVPLLNTSRLINEYLKTSRGLAKAYHLDQIFNEFIASLKSDIIINYYWGTENVNQIIDKLNKQSNSRLQIMEYLHYTIGTQYLDWAKKYLLFIVPQAREKKKIERAIRCFIPELLSYGYNRDEIYHSAKQILIGEIDPETALENFINKFDLKRHKYVVYTAISEQLLIFQKILERRLEISFSDDGNFENIESWSHYRKIKTSTITALDASTAAETAYKNIELFTSFYQFFGDYSGRLIQNRVFVISDSGETRKITVDRGKYSSVEYTNPPKIGHLAEVCISGLVFRDCPSLPQIKKIIKLHNRAIAANGLENGLLNLWSILEVICVTNPDASKIEQVRKVVVPILMRDYFPSIFVDIANNIKETVGSEEFNTLLSGISESETDYIQIACLILLPKYEKKLDSFIESLLNYPVLRTRILNLHDECTRNNDLFVLTEHYANRISWHLYRIYRARNSIIHSGKRPTDLKDLGEHLHTYVDSVMCEVIVKLSKGVLCNTSNVLIESELIQEKWENALKKGVPITFETLKLIFEK